MYCYGQLLPHVLPRVPHITDSFVSIAIKNFTYLLKHTSVPTLSCTINRQVTIIANPLCYDFSRAATMPLITHQNRKIQTDRCIQVADDLQGENNDKNSTEARQLVETQPSTSNQPLPYEPLPTFQSSLSRTSRRSFVKTESSGDTNHNKDPLLSQSGNFPIPFNAIKTEPMEVQAHHRRSVMRPKTELRNGVSSQVTATSRHWSKKRRINPLNQSSSSVNYDEASSARQPGPPPAYDDVTTNIVSSMIIELDEDFEMINEVIAEELTSTTDNDIDAIVKAACPIVIE